MTNKISINPADLEIEWSSSNTYRLAFNSGVTIEDGNNFSPSAANTSTVSFTPFATNPQLTTRYPTLGSVDIALPNIELSYNRPIFKKTGNFYIYKEDALYGDELIDTISTNDSRVTFQATSVNIDMSASLTTFKGGTTYYLTSDAGVVTDIFGLTSLVIDKTVIRFTYRVNPPVTLTVPSYNATDIFLPTITITSNRTLSKGTGNFYLYRDYPFTDELKLTIPVTSSTVVTSGTSVSINLTNQGSVFESGRTYYLTSDEYAIVDNVYLPIVVTQNNLKFDYRLDPYPSTITLTPSSQTISSATTTISFTATIGLLTTGTISLKEVLPNGGFYPDFYVTQYLDEGIDYSAYQGMTSSQSITPFSLIGSTQTSITVSRSAGGTNPIVPGNRVTVYSRSNPGAFIYGQIYTYVGNTITVGTIAGYPGTSVSTPITVSSQSTAYNDWNIAVSGYGEHTRQRPLVRTALVVGFQDASGFNKFDKNLSIKKIAAVNNDLNIGRYLVVLDSTAGGFQDEQGQVSSFKVPAFYLDGNYTLSPTVNGVILSVVSQPGRRYTPSHLLISDPVTKNVGYYILTSPYQQVTTQQPVGNPLYDNLNDWYLVLKFKTGVDILLDNQDKWTNNTWFRSLNKIGGWYSSDQETIAEEDIFQNSNPALGSFPSNWEDNYTTLAQFEPRPPAGVNSTATYIDKVLGIGHLEVTLASLSTNTTVISTATIVSTATTFTINKNSLSTSTELQQLGYHFYQASIGINERNNYLYNGTSTTSLSYIKI